MQILTPLPAAAPLLPPSLPIRALAADPALLLQAAAIAAATPWTALDRLVSSGRAAGIPVPQGQPLPMPPATLPAETTAPAATIIAAVLNRGLGPSAAVAAALPLAALATAGASQPIRAADRLTLSPALAALRADPVIARHRPAAALMLDLLTGLTGEAPERLQLLAFDAPDRAGQAISTAAVPRAPGELLQLLVRGTVQGLDAQQVEITLGLSVQRQSGPVRLDAALLDSILATLEQLARMPVDLDYPDAAAALAGQTARFQAVLDPAGLWPMQSFLLSGLLIFGPARDDAASSDDVDEAGDDDERDDDSPADMKSHDDDDPEADKQAPTRKRRQMKAVAELPASVLPVDGGPPIISASHWLTLELQHWQAQLRQWMQLPEAPRVR